jgi:transposase
VLHFAYFGRKTLVLVSIGTQEERRAAGPAGPAALLSVSLPFSPSFLDPFRHPFRPLSLNLHPSQHIYAKLGKRNFLSVYGCSIIPARPGRPQDKAKVEVGVQVVERWILARLRKRTFMTLAELNDAISELIVDLNNRPFKRLPGSRAELFAALDAPALKPLPARRYEFATWKEGLKVSTDYHVTLYLGEGRYHYYSVPHPLVGRNLNLRLTASLVEIFHGRKLVATHQRDDTPGQPTTEPEHMPKAHQRFLDWTPRRIRSDAGYIGPSCRALIDHILEKKRHPEQGYRACLGIIRLRKIYTDDRLEAACARAMHYDLFNYGSVKSILEKQLDRRPLPEQPELFIPTPNSHVRGADYYQGN